MKFWLRLAACAAALLSAVDAQAQISVTGISASPQTAKPGDTVTFTVAVSNAASVNYTASATLTVTLTNLASGATFTAGPTSVSPTGGFVAAATANPTTGENTPGTGSYSFTSVIPTKLLRPGITVHRLLSLQPASVLFR